MKLVSKSTAKSLGLIRYFTGKPCKYGHIVERLVKQSKCVACNRENVKKRIKKGCSLYASKLRRQNLKRGKGGVSHNKNMAHIKKWSKSNTPGAIKYRLALRLRHRLYQAIKGNIRSGSAVRDLGCSIAEFRDYIAKQFSPGMSWDNHGEWELDHIKPLASFDLTNRNQLLLAVHYTNIQPLWAAENQAKGAKCL